MTAEQANSYKVDKTGWGEGPWMHEPDRVDFRHVGFPCLLRRHERKGHWCGYVGVPPGHPLYGKNYHDTAVADLRAHGGITYAARCAGDVCHVPKPGEPDDVWWLGFDCAHAFDLSPGMEAFERQVLPKAMIEEHDALRERMPSHLRERYRTLAWVRGEVRHLAQQLAVLE